jgi:hypothetical protein
VTRKARPSPAAAWLGLPLLAACSLLPPALRPPAASSSTVASTLTPSSTLRAGRASPGPALPRDLAASPTPIDLEACAESQARLLGDMASAIGLDEFKDVYSLVLYHVGSGALAQPEFGFAPPGLQVQQADTAAHERVWEAVRGIFPDEERRRIRFLLLYTDGAGGSLAGVRQAGSPYFWRLAVDLVDAAQSDLLSVALVHELGHLVSLNDTQVIPNVELFDHPEDEELLEEKRAACSSFFTPTGCSRINSYVNLFFERYWSGIYEEWRAAVSAEDVNATRRGLEAIYADHPDDFVSEYAVSSPAEDLAESFMYFVLSPRPAGEALADEKVRFFYGFSALVRMRLGILRRLCSPASEP